MKQNHYDVDPDQLDGHAGSIGGVADALATVGGRLPDSLGAGSLGAFAQFLTAGLAGAMGQTAAAIAHASTTTNQLGAGMSDTATAYRRLEDQNSAPFTREDVQ